VTGPGQPTRQAGPARQVLLVAAMMAWVVSIAGCSIWPKSGEPGLRDATAEELAQLLKERETAIHTIKGLFRAQVKGAAGLFTQRVEGAMYYRRPDALRLQGFNQVGGALFDFVLAEDLYRLRLSSGKTYQGRVGDLSQIGPIGKPIQLSVLAMSGVVGTASVKDGETVRLSEDGDRYRLDVLGSSDGPQAEAGKPFRRIWFERRLLQVVQEDRLAPSGEVEASVQFEDFRPIHAQGPEPAEPVQDMKDTGRGESTLPETAAPLLKPFKILTDGGQGLGTLQLTFHEIVPNPDLKPEELGVVLRRQEPAVAGVSRVTQGSSAR
jgi:hypothetical protein